MIATPPPRGVGIAWELRSFGLSKMDLRRAHERYKQVSPHDTIIDVMEIKTKKRIYWASVLISCRSA